MQLSQAYFYFIIHATYKPSATEFLKAVDFDQNNILSVGEIGFLLTRLTPLQDRHYTISDFQNACLNLTQSQNIKIEHILECKILTDLIDVSIRNVATYKHEVIDASDVTFLMLKGDHPQVKSTLDRFRRSMTKFGCLNDDLKHADSLEGTRIAKEYSDFYQTMCPEASPFENPPGI